MKGKLLLALVIVVAIGLIAWSLQSGRFGWSMQPPAAPLLIDAATLPPQSDARSEEAERLLERRIARVHFDQLPFDACIDFIRKECQANFCVLWRSFDADDLKRNAAIELDLHDVSAAALLSQVLEANSTTTRLGYTIDDGIIIIGTEDYLAHYAMTRVYDVRDLIESMRALSSQRNETVEELAESLVALITDAVAPPSWALNGGTGMIRCLHGRLIIGTTWSHHRAVQRLLSEMRQPIGQWRLEPAPSAVAPAGPRGTGEVAR